MAFEINQVFIIGRLTRDPELSHTQSGKSVCKFGVANNPGKEDTDVCFFDVTAWGKTGESIAQYKKKGEQIGIVGRLRQSRWQDENGNNRSKIEIVASSVQFIGGGNSGNSNAISNNTGSVTRNQESNLPMTNNNNSGYGDDPAGEIPF